MAIAKPKQTKEIKLPLEEIEAPLPPPKPKTFKFISSLYMVNPFTQDRYQVGQITEITEKDGWTQAQIDAKILTPCP